MRIFNDIKDALLATKMQHPEFDCIITDSTDEHLRYNHFYANFKVSDSDIYKEQIKDWEDAKKIEFMLYCIAQCDKYSQRRRYNWSDEVHVKNGVRDQFLIRLMKSRITFDDTQADKIITAFIKKKALRRYDITDWPVASFLTNLTKQYKEHSISEDLKSSLSKLKKVLEKNRYGYNEKTRIKLIEKINNLINPVDDSVFRPVLFSGIDEFTPYANKVIEDLPDRQRKIWYQLIAKAQKASGGKPSQKYLNESKSIIKELGTDHFKKMVNDWLVFIRTMQGGIQERKRYYGSDLYDYHTFIFLDGLNNETLKGFVWMCAHFHDATTLQNIANLGERCHKKVSGVGSPAAAVGNACFYTLYKSKGLDGIGKLSTLKTKIKQKTALKIIDKYLTQAAKDKGISLHEVQDLSIDDYGLNEGKRTYTFEEYTATISITKPGKSTLTWLKPDGKTQKSIPAFVKNKHAAKLKKMKNTKKQIDQTTSAQRNRIDRMFKADRTWNMENFEKLFLRHGLMCTLTKQLIWNFTHDNTSQSAFYLNDQWVNYKKEPVTLHPKTAITLWHPALQSLEEVQGWRSFLMENEIQQPLKQAFREIYLLTEAEINTRTYSNRMAAHIIKQHQYISLAKARNWSADLSGDWDSDSTARLNIPEYNLRAEFWVDGVREGTGGIWDYLSTDQIRFVDTTTHDVVELANVPPIVFSEVLRDVDLFVGVASVGNDPTWQDGGGRHVFRDYWHSYSFGDLSAIAKNRKEILENLVPRLKIKDIAQVTDKYVIVKGKLRTYKIHIGSTNILMEPNDQYLCIVPDRSKKDFTSKLFIPFEGDKSLSVILSKAFLLANDDKITDSSITSQINRK